MMKEIFARLALGLAVFALVAGVSIAADETGRLDDVGPGSLPINAPLGVTEDARLDSNPLIEEDDQLNSLLDGGLTKDNPFGSVFSVPGLDDFDNGQGRGIIAADLGTLIPTNFPATYNQQLNTVPSVPSSNDVAFATAILPIAGGNNSDNFFIVSAGYISRDYESPTDVDVFGENSLLIGTVPDDDIVISIVPSDYGAYVAPQTAVGPFDAENPYVVSTLDVRSGSTGSSAATGFSQDRAYDVAIQPQGEVNTNTNNKILVVGTTRYRDLASNTLRSDMVVARFDASGALDTSFNNRGYTIIDFGGIDFGRALVVARHASTTKIYAAGFDADGNMLIARLQADGRRDNSFGPNQDGLVVIPMPNSAERAEIYDMAIVDDGDNSADNDRLILVGSVTNANDPEDIDVLITRINTETASLDFDFSGNGIFNSSNLFDADQAAQNIEKLYSVAIQPGPAQKIAVAGFVRRVVTDPPNAPQRAQMIVGRVLQSGAIDTTFNGSSFYTSSLGNNAIAHAIAVQPNARIVVAGFCNDGNTNQPSSSDGVILRFENEPNGADTQSPNRDVDTIADGILDDEETDSPEADTAAFGAAPAHEDKNGINVVNVAPVVIQEDSCELAANESSERFYALALQQSSPLPNRDVGRDATDVTLIDYIVAGYTDALHDRSTSPVSFNLDFNLNTLVARFDGDLEIDPQTTQNLTVVSQNDIVKYPVKTGELFECGDANQDVPPPFAVPQISTRQVRVDGMRESGSNVSDTVAGFYNLPTSSDCTATPTGGSNACTSSLRTWVPIRVDIGFTAALNELTRGGLYDITNARPLVAVRVTDFIGGGTVAPRTWSALAANQIDNGWFGYDLDNGGMLRGWVKESDLVCLRHQTSAKEGQLQETRVIVGGLYPVNNNALLLGPKQERNFTTVTNTTPQLPSPVATFSANSNSYTFNMLPTNNSNPLIVNQNTTPYDPNVDAINGQQLTFTLAGPDLSCTADADNTNSLAIGGGTATIDPVTGDFTFTSVSVNSVNPIYVRYCAYDGISYGEGTFTVFPSANGTGSGAPVIAPIIILP